MKYNQAFDSKKKSSNRDLLFAKYNSLGLKLLEKNNLNDALKNFVKAIEYRDDKPETLTNIGLIFHLKNKLPEAEFMYRKSLYFDNTKAENYYNLGIILSQQNKNKEAIEAYEKSLELNPNHPNTLKFLGNLYKDSKLFHKALKIYKKWSVVIPNNAESDFNQSLIHIRNGRLDLGWKMYEAGLKNNIRELFEGYKLETSLPWDGEPFDGNLLVYGEQGIGDQIMFGTLLPELIEVQKRIIIQVDQRLVNLFKRTFPEIQVFGDKSSIDSSLYKEFISMGSLCKLFRNSTSDFLKNRTHVFSDNKTLTKTIKKKMPHAKLLKIGFSWHSFATRTSSERSLTEENVSKIISSNNHTFINLQYGNVQHSLEKINTLGKGKIYTIPSIDLTQDLDSVLSIIKNCDLIITIDNSLAHLSSCLGKPTWILLPYSANFRWFEKIVPALWYNNTSLIRQSHENSWDNVVNNITEALNNTIASVK